MSKRMITLLVLLGISTTLWAQDETDALRYSRLTPGGTARAQAIGGAMGSLGGDISALSVNPAGIGFFKTNEISFTPGLLSVTSNGTYLGNTASDSKTNFYLGNLGLVIAADKRKGSSSKWQNVTVGLSVNRLANYNNNVYISGVNNQSSLSEKYIEELGVTDPNQAVTNYPFGSSLALNTYLLDPAYNDNNELIGYSSNVFNAPSVIQDNTISTKGNINEFSIGVAGNYDDKLYIGGSLNIPSIRYRRTNTYSETNTENNPADNFEYFTLRETLSTDGVGLNGKFGLVFQPMPSIRVGAAFHTPTVYTMEDTYEASMETNTGNYQGTKQQSSADLTDGYPGQYKYTMVTPLRAVGSFSYIFGTGADNVGKQQGFITVDYEFINYGSAKYRFNSSDATADDKALADNLNKSISKLYKSASNIRVGGELKFDIFAVRAGFAWYGSPYEDSNVKGNELLYSGGVGFRNKGVFADLTYIYSQNKYPYSPYQLNDKQVSSAAISSNGNNIVFTLGFKL